MSPSRRMEEGLLKDKNSGTLEEVSKLTFSKVKKKITIHKNNQENMAHVQEKL